MSKLKGLLDSAIQAGYSSLRELARLAGSIISVALAVGPIARLLTRQMYFAIETRSAWVNVIHFPPSLQQELKFWYCNLYSKLLTPNGARTQLIASLPTTTPSFQGSTLNLPPLAAAALTPLLRIGEMRTTGSALL